MTYADKLVGHQISLGHLTRKQNIKKKPVSNKSSSVEVTPNSQKTVEEEICGTIAFQPGVKGT